ncbi:MAG TPA: LPS assembly lipoprotein LptE [Chitinispirillaceae bacterium]|nr:LPS assembly lipoprotein LptE [Chitinispirillaceae bacterium]
MRKVCLLFTVLTGLLFWGCNIYTFSNSALPSHLKTIDIPLFQNNSLEPNIADEITQELSKQVTNKGQIKIASGRGDATISGSINKYENVPHTYDASKAREVNVERYIVKISSEVEFRDNVKNNELYKGVVTGEGIYDPKTEEEKVGKEKAVKDIVTRILENSIQSW